MQMNKYIRTPVGADGSASTSDHRGTRSPCPSAAVTTRPVMLSVAKHLCAPRDRSFAALRMTRHSIPSPRRHLLGPYGSLGRMLAPLYFYRHCHSATASWLLH